MQFTSTSKKLGIRHMTRIFILLLFVLPSVQSLDAKSIIVAIGDSITKGDTKWTLLEHRNTIQGGWVTRLQRKLDADFPDEYQVINKGINGDTAQGILNRLHQDVISYQPQIVIVAVGTNDAYGFAGVNIPARNADDYRTVMSKIFQQLQVNLPDVPVFVMGMTTPLKKYIAMSNLSWIVAGLDQAFLDKQFSAYNRVLQELSKEFGYIYVDIPSQWPHDIEASWKFYAEGLHPNDDGYNKMTEIVYGALCSTVIHPIVSVEFVSQFVTIWGQIKRGRI